MKRFLIWLTVVIATVVAVDMTLGVLFERYIESHTLPGDYESVEKVLRHSDSDLLVLGSSVSLNSLNTKTIEDSLHVSTYNGGGNGQTFPFYLTMLKSAISRHVPSRVILCLQPNALSSHGSGTRYNLLAPYYGLGIADIDSNMNSMRPLNRYMLKSTSYRLNNIWFRILLYHLVTPDLRGENGHIAKPVPPIFPTRNAYTLGRMTPERRAQLSEFMQICRDNDIDLTIIFTPVFTEFTDMDDSDNIINEVKAIASPYDVHVYNDLNLEPIASHAEMFYDNVHINVHGTSIYTDTIINRLKSNNDE